MELTVVVLQTVTITFTTATTVQTAVLTKLSHTDA